MIELSPSGLSPSLLIGFFVRARTREGGGDVYHTKSKNGGRKEQRVSSIREERRGGEVEILRTCEWSRSGKENAVTQRQAQLV